jgi:hypothetical protein
MLTPPSNARHVCVSVSQWRWMEDKQITLVTQKNQEEAEGRARERSRARERNLNAHQDICALLAKSTIGW